MENFIVFGEICLLLQWSVWSDADAIIKLNVHPVAANNVILPRKNF